MYKQMEQIPIQPRARHDPQQLPGCKRFATTLWRANMGGLQKKKFELVGALDVSAGP